MATKTKKELRIEELTAQKAAAEQAAGDAAVTVENIQQEMREKVTAGRGERDLIIAEQFKNQERRDELAQFVAFEHPEVPPDNPLRLALEQRYQELVAEKDNLKTQFIEKNQAVQDLHVELSGRYQEAQQRQRRAERDKFAAEQRLQELQTPDDGGQSQ